MKDRIHTFIYSNKQEELVGKDGIDEFSDIFYKKSRLVIILYREKWGNTPWTRIEETAIKNRCLDEGWDFSILIPLDENKATPKYFPKSRIWLNFDRYGYQGAASFIESKLTEIGGKIEEDNAITKAERFKKRKEFENKLNTYMLNSQAVEDSREEFTKLKEESAKYSDEIFKDMPPGFKTNKDFNHFIVYYNPYQLEIIWKQFSSNMIDDAYLLIQFVKFEKIEDHFQTKLKPRIIESSKYFFTKDYNWNSCWKKENDNSTFIYTNNLKESLFNRLLGYIDGSNKEPINTNIWI